MIRLPYLSPQRARTALDLFAGAVVVSVAIALAGLTWRIAGHAGTGAVAVPSGAQPVALDAAPTLAFAPFGQGAVLDSSQPTALPLRLKGVFAASSPALSVAYIEVGSETALPFRIGESAGGGVIEAIQRDRVLLRVNGRIEYLAFPDPALTADEQAAASAGQPAPQPQPASGQPPTPTAPSAAAAAALANLTPAPGGLAVGAAPPPGLQTGDVVTSINGSPVTSQQAAATALAAAQARGSAQIQITRDGKPVTLTVPTR